MRTKTLIGMLVTILAMNAACSTCAPSTSAAVTKTTTSTLSVSSDVTTYKLEVTAAEQDCGAGCNLCTDPIVTMTLSGQVSWDDPTDATAAPVVRLTLTPVGSLSDADTVEPPSPIDVAILPATSSTADFRVVVSHTCPTNQGCVLDYILSIERVETNGSGNVDVVLNADATYTTKAKGGVTVSIDQESGTP
jgi:hypothetical protein